MTASASRPGFVRALAFIAAWSAVAGPALAQESRPAPSPSALEKDPAGWTDLLAGAGPDLKGWTRGPIPPPPKGKLQDRLQWKIDPSTGYLVCEGNGGHEWLRWDQELGDAVFHVEFRYTPVEGKKGYNSGAYARNSADAAIWHQAQFGDRSGGYLFGESPDSKGKLKSFNTLKKGEKSLVRAAGEWNTLEITAKDKDLTLWTNGVETAAFHECGAARGYVGLEAEGYRIEFRNVKVKPLAEGKEAGK